MRYLRLALKLEIEDVIPIAHHRREINDEPGSEEFGIVTAATTIVRGNCFRLVDKVRLATIRRCGGNLGQQGGCRADGIEAQ